MDTSAQGPLEKLNHIHNSYKAMLENTLAGYCLPDPYNVPRLREVIEVKYRSFYKKLCVFF